MSEKLREEYQQMFTVLDKKGSGNITKDQYIELISDCTSNFSKEDLNLLKDKMPDKIDEETFFKISEHLCKPSYSETQISEAFKVFGSIVGSDKINKLQLKDLMENIGGKLSDKFIQNFIIAAKQKGANIDYQSFAKKLACRSF